MKLSLVSVLGAAVALNAFAAQDLTAQLEYVGNPTLERWPTRGSANSILDIEVNDDRLFFACGEWASNPGPVFMKSYDPYSGAFTNEYAAGTEGVEVLRTFSDGGLYFPAIDHMDKGSYDNGYWFKRAKGGEWSAGFANGTDKKLYTHVYDMQQFGEWMFLYSGCPVGSKDGGANWLRLDGLSSNKQNGSLLRCGNELFCVEAYPIDFGTGTNPNATPMSDPYTRHGPTVWRWDAATEKFTSTVHPTWNDLAPEIILSDCNLVTTIESQSGRPGRFWHTTPFKDRCLYVIGDEYSDRTYDVNGKSVKLKPVGTRPQIAVSAYAENGALKGTRIHLPAKTWPIDFTVVGDTAYMLAFSYVPDTQMVRHGVWKSTDGVSFTEILTVDYPQVMQAFDYHLGYFYFGVAHQNAEPNLGPIKAKTPETAGDIYRVYYPQEPVAAVASVATLAVGEGGTANVDYTLSSAPKTNVTLKVELLDESCLTLSAEQLVFTPSDWNTPHRLTVTYLDNDRSDPESVTLVCGVATPTSLRGRFDSREVTTSLVKVTPVSDDSAPTVAFESFDNAAIPLTYRATLSDLGFLNGQPAESAILTVTAYDDAACMHAVGSVSKSVTAAGEVSVSLADLVRGTWYTFVVEVKTSDAVAHRFLKRMLSPISASPLVDLTDDIDNRAGYYGVNGGINPPGNFGAWDNNDATYFGGSKKPQEAVYIFKVPMVVNGFALRGMGKTDDNQDRQPSAYSLYGSNDTNGVWTLLAQVTDAPIWDPAGEWRRFVVTNETSYTCYKLALDAAQMPNMSVISAAEVELYHIEEQPPEEPPEEPEEPPVDPQPEVTNGFKLAYWSMSGVSTMNQTAADSRTTCFAQHDIDIIAMQGLKNANYVFDSNGYAFVLTNATNGSSDGNGRQFAWRTDRYTRIGSGGTVHKPTTNCSTDWIVLEDNETHEKLVVGSAHGNNSLAKYMKGMADVLNSMTNDFPVASVFYCGNFAGFTNQSDFVSRENTLAQFAAKGLYPLVAGDDYQWILTTDASLSGTVSSLADADCSTKAGYIVTFACGESPTIELVPPEFAADGSALGFESDVGGARKFTLKIANPVKGAYYTVLTSTTLEGPFLPEGDSVLFDQDSGTLTLEVSADSPRKFAKILVSVGSIN